jgi:P pilus assembly chaperone PapD
MPETIINIIPRKYCENSQVTQYTATNCKTVIDKFTMTNNSTNHVNFSVNLVVQGGTAGANNRVINQRYVAPGETYLCPELVGQTLENGGFISTIASAATSIVLSSSGREIT